MKVFCPIEQLSCLINVKGRSRSCLEVKFLSGYESVSIIRHQIFSQIVEIICLLGPLKSIR